MTVPELLARNRSLVEAEMRTVLAGRDLPIYDMARYALGWQEANGQVLENGGGKGLRPALCLLTADAVDGSEPARRRALAGAAAVEFVHNYSLVHDDIQDGDEERHHRPTVWMQWGTAQGINVGDALRELAQLALDRAQAAGASADTVLAAHRILSASALEMIEGQYLDLTFEGAADVAVDDYLSMIGRKTGAMIGCSMALGALLACGDEQVAARLNAAGRRLGLCFQIRDDFLGIWGDSARTGKSSENDIRRRKKSYPVVYAFATAGAAERATLDQSYARADLSADAVEAVMGVLTTLGADKATEQAAREQRDAFERELAACELSPEARGTCLDVAEFILRREH